MSVSVRVCMCVIARMYVCECVGVYLPPCFEHVHVRMRCAAAQRNGCMYMCMLTTHRHAFVAWPQLACIRECGQQDGDKAMVMVSQLLGPYGSHHFDRLSSMQCLPR